MNALEIIAQDHRIINRMLKNMELALLAPSQKTPIVVGNVVNYLVREMEGYFGEEERLIFRPVAALSRDAAAVVGALEEEHTDLSQRLAALRRTVDACREKRGQGRDDTFAALRRQGLDFVKELVHHIFLEEQVLFPLAGKLLGPERLAEIAEGMRAFEEETRYVEAYAAD